MNLRRMGTVRDYSSWKACEDDPNVTLYSKRVDFNIRMPVGPTIMMQVTFYCCVCDAEVCVVDASAVATWRRWCWSCDFVDYLSVAWESASRPQL